MNRIAFLIIIFVGAIFLGAYESVAVDLNYCNQEMQKEIQFCNKNPSYKVGGVNCYQRVQTNLNRCMGAVKNNSSQGQTSSGLSYYHVRKKPTNDYGKSKGSSSSRNNSYSNPGHWTHSSGYKNYGYGGGYGQKNKVAYYVKVSNNTPRMLTCRTDISILTAKGRQSDQNNATVSSGQTREVASLGPATGGGKYEIRCW